MIGRGISSPLCDIPAKLRPLLCFYSYFSHEKYNYTTVLPALSPNFSAAAAAAAASSAAAANEIQQQLLSPRSG